MSGIQAFFENIIELVLDLVLRPARQEFGNLGPLIAELFVLSQDNLVLLRCHLALLDFRVKLVVPALTALLVGAFGQGFGDGRPFDVAAFGFLIYYNLVFLSTP